MQDHPDETPSNETGTDSGCFRAPVALIAEENTNAEFLIGLDGSPDDDAVGKLAAFRAEVQMAEDAQKRIAAATVRAQKASAAEEAPITTAGASEHASNKAMEAAADVAALHADHKSACVDMRTLARSMGDRFQQ